MNSTELHIGLVQTELHWENPQRNVERFDQLIDQGPRGLDMLILPEMFSTGFTMNPARIPFEEAERTLTWMKGKARETESLVLGSLVWPVQGEMKGFTNRLFAVFPNGEVEYYDKRHCFTLAGEDQVYLAGQKRLVFEWKGFRVCPLICYDLRFPVWSRNTEDYDLLLYVANWPAPRIAAWDLLLAARAVENMAYCVGVNRIGKDQENHSYPGHSSVYGPLGEPLLYCGSKEGVFEARLNKPSMLNLRKKLQFLDDRDGFELS